MKRRAASAILLVLIFAATALLVAPAESRGQAQPAIGKCTLCHGKRGFKKIDENGKEKSLFVDERELAKSVHAKRTCNDCHTDVVEIPHKQTPGRVHCVRCHYKGNPDGAPQSDMYLQYESSVHGKAAAARKPDAPLCQDCHGAHDIRKIKDPLSHVAHRELVQTCGRCHEDMLAKYSKSVHGKAVLQEGNASAPDCTGCHGEHAILAPTDPNSKVYPTHVSQSCSRCHADVNIVGKYGIEVEQVAAFEESFHGIATKFGMKTVANCASCHGVHDILPPSDPQSRVNVANIPQTCGKCHPGANPNFAKGKIHVNAAKKEAGIIFWVASFFKVLTAGTMVALVAHILLDIRKKRKEARERL